MKSHAKCQWFLNRDLAISLACMVFMALPFNAPSEDSSTNSVSAKVAASPKQGAPASPQKPKHELTGAELYSMHCNRCHPERYPTERTAAQWKTILLHMRVRANLPAEQARTILKYLQENSGR
jgi:hypothetical protein